MKAGKSVVFALIMITFLLSASFVSAHAPLGEGDGQTLETATFIPDPAKSWAIYSSLREAGDAHYFVFDIEEGEKIYFSLFISAGAREAGFIPTVALMGPGLTDEGPDLPSFVDTPTGDNGVIVVESEIPASGTFEPFSPSGFYELSELDIDAPATGDYYIVVFENDIGGNFGLAIGYIETYTIDEWILLPFTLISIYEWTGQNILLVLAPIIFVLVLGTLVLVRDYRKGKAPKTPLQWMIAVSGLLALSWGASVLFQTASAMLYCSIASEIVITMGFAAVSVFIAIYMIQTAKKDPPIITRGRGILLIVFGGLMIGFLSGFLIGPILAIAAGIMTILSKKKQEVSPTEKDVKK